MLDALLMEGREEGPSKIVGSMCLANEKTILSVRITQGSLTNVLEVSTNFGWVVQSCLVIKNFNAHH